MGRARVRGGGLVGGGGADRARGAALGRRVVGPQLIRGPLGGIQLSQALDTYVCLTHSSVMHNRVRSLRKKKGHSQRQLAAAASTSQQQVQRIESSGQAASLDLASRIAEALEAPLEKVFPTAKALRVHRKPKKGAEQRSQAALEAAGFDTDNDSWFVVVTLSNGPKIELPISSSDRTRLARVLPEGRGTRFFVFDSGAHHILVGLRHAAVVQALWEPSAIVKEFAAPDFDQTDVTVYLRGGPEPLAFTAAPDWEEHGDMGRLEYLMSVAESWGELDDAFFSFLDGDGETVYLNGEDVALLAVPMWLTDEEYSNEEAREEQKGADEAAR